MDRFDAKRFIIEIYNEDEMKGGSSRTFNPIRWLVKSYIK